MTDDERAAHRPGGAVHLDERGAMTLNTRTLADVYDIELVGNGKSFHWRWTPKP